MATTIKALARGSFATSSATLYTVPASTTTVVTNISICNTTASAITFNLLFDSVELFSSSAVPANSTVMVDLKQALATTKIISGYASDTGTKFHITGAEIV
jgi:hypothetical protein